MFDTIQNGFTGNPLNRHTDLRKDEKYIQEQLESPTTLFALFHQNKALISSASSNGEDLKVDFRKLQEIKEKASEEEYQHLTFVFLGTYDDNTAVFAIDISNIKEELFVSESAKFIEVRSVATQINYQEGAILGEARSIVGWHSKHKFCANCGSSTKVIQGGHKRACENEKCKTFHYPRIDPCVIMVITTKDRSKCLLGRQKVFPKGMYTALAGFMEPGESIEEAVRRESFEESGVKVGKIYYHSSQPWPYPCQIMIGCIGEAEIEDLNVDQSELEDAKWFTREQIAKGFENTKNVKDMENWMKGTDFRFPLSFAVAHQLIKAWYDNWK